MSDKPTGTTSKKPTGRPEWRAIRARPTEKAGSVEKEGGMGNEEEVEVYVTNLTTRAQMVPMDDPFRMMMTNVRASFISGEFNRFDVPQEVQGVREGTGSVCGERQGGRVQKMRKHEGNMQLETRMDGT